ncbi:DegT/DnrJ/EryC1/StrS family aminotransferase [Cupriavidus basilensis]
MVTTERPRAVVRQLPWSCRDHGKSWDAVYKREHPPRFSLAPPNLFGTNWRMLEMQAAIGRLQLASMPDWTRRRSRHARLLAEAFQDMDAIRVPLPPEHSEHAWYKFSYAYVRPEALRSDWCRDRIMSEVLARGVPCYAGTRSGGVSGEGLRQYGLAAGASIACRQAARRDQSDAAGPSYADRRRGREDGAGRCGTL